jgi:hypothetical protein
MILDDPKVALVVLDFRWHVSARANFLMAFYP